MFLSAGQTSDYTGAAALLSSLPAAKVLLAPSHGLQANHCRATDRGYDADWFRDALADRGIEACIPSKTEKSISHMTKRAIATVTKLKTCSANSRTGDVSTPATTGAQTFSGPPSPSLSSSSSGYKE
jgi:hypothetical protein